MKRKEMICFNCSKGGEILLLSTYGNVSCKYKPCHLKCRLCGFLKFKVEINEVYSVYTKTRPILLMYES